MGNVRRQENVIFRGLQSELDLNKETKDSEHPSQHAAIQWASISWAREGLSTSLELAHPGPFFLHCTCILALSCH